MYYKFSNWDLKLSLPIPWLFWFAEFCPEKWPKNKPKNWTKSTELPPCLVVVEHVVVGVVGQHVTLPHDPHQVVGVGGQLLRMCDVGLQSNCLIFTCFLDTTHLIIASKLSLLMKKVALTPYFLSPSSTCSVPSSGPSSKVR